MPRLGAGGQHLSVRPAPPQVVLGLHSGDGLDGVSAPDGVGGGLGHAEVTDLPGLDQGADRSGHLLDGHVGVDAVLVVQVDGLQPEPTQRALDGLGELVRAEHPTARGPGLGVDVLGELGGDRDLVAERCERLADELLVDVRTVDLGGVEEGDAEVDRPVQEGDHVGPVGSAAVAAGHRHAAEADGRDLESAGSESARVHGSAPICRGRGLGVWLGRRACRQEPSSGSESESKIFFATAIADMAFGHPV